MRAAVIFFGKPHSKKTASIASALAQGIRGQNIDTELIDGNVKPLRSLTGFQYLALGIEPAGILFKRLPQGIKFLLEASGSLINKRCLVFIPQRTWFSGRLLQKAMQLAESQGLLVKNSLLIASESEALEYGKKLHVEKDKNSM